MTLNEIICHMGRKMIAGEVKKGPRLVRDTHASNLGLSHMAAICRFSIRFQFTNP